MKLCGAVTKSGKSCGYRLGEGRECPHHSGDGSVAKRFQLKGALASQEAQTIPDLTVDLTSEEGIAQTLQGLSEKAARIKNVNLRRIAEIRQCCNVAVGLRQAAATRELNQSLLRLEHGARAVAVLQQMKAADRILKPLPGTPRKLGTHVE